MGSLPGGAPEPLIRDRSKPSPARAHVLPDPAGWAVTRAADSCVLGTGATGGDDERGPGRDAGVPVRGVVDHP